MIKSNDVKFQNLEYQNDILTAGGMSIRAKILLKYDQEVTRNHRRTQANAFKHCIIINTYYY